jgi:hypothetical protein
MPSHLVHPEALPPPKLSALRESLLASPLVSTSPLAGSFRGSRGFALTFTADGQPSVEERFPFLVPFLRLAQDAQARRALQPVWRRPRALNGFYLNLLLLEEGAGVGRHVDGTLRGPSGVARALPELVAVVYLSVPAVRSGGELVLSRGARHLATVRPSEGMRLLFRGELDHEVRPLAGCSPGAVRASLVLEQYALPPSGAARLPPLAVHSRGGFEAYLLDRSRVQTHTGKLNIAKGLRPLAGGESACPWVVGSVVRRFNLPQLGRIVASRVPANG